MRYCTHNTRAERRVGTVSGITLDGHLISRVAGGDAPVPNWLISIGEADRWRATGAEQRGADEARLLFGWLRQQQWSYWREGCGCSLRDSRSIPWQRPQFASGTPQRLSQFLVFVLAGMFRRGRSMTTKFELQRVTKVQTTSLSLFLSLPLSSSPYPSLSLPISLPPAVSIRSCERVRPPS